MDRVILDLSSSFIKSACWTFGTYGFFTFLKTFTDKEPDHDHETSGIIDSLYEGGAIALIKAFIF